MEFPVHAEKPTALHADTVGDHKFDLGIWAKSADTLVDVANDHSFVTNSSYPVSDIR